MNRREQRRRQALARKSAPEAPNYAWVHYDAGVAFQQQGKQNEAIVCYRRALEANPDLVEAWNNLGNVHKAQSRLNEAIACYGRVLEIDADYAMAHYNLGNVLRDQGKLDEAIAHYNRALDINPDDADALNNCGNAQRDKGDLDQALACYCRVVAINPNHALGHYNLGNVLRDKKELDEAVASYKRAIKLQPNYAMCHHELGRLLEKRGKLEKAIASYRRTIEIKPDFAHAHFNLGHALRAIEKPDLAIKSFRRAVDIKPDYADAWNHLGNALNYLDKRDDAVDCYQRALEIRPQFAEARLNLARNAKFVPGDPELKKLKDLVDRKELSEDNRNQLMFVLGKAHDDVGLYAEAFSYFERGNKEMNELVSFDPSKHRRKLKAIRDAYQETSSIPNEAAASSGLVPIFILGMSRAGKTLVESLVSKHAETHGAGERYEWFNAIERVRKSHSITEGYPKCMQSLTVEYIREIGQIYLNDMSQYNPDAKFIVNTMPGHHQYVPLLFQALPTAKLIYCYREPLEQCLIVYFKRYAARNKHAYDFRNIATYYASYHELMAHWQESFGGRMLSVAYEELVRNPREVGRCVYAYCGLDYDPDVIPERLSTDEIGHWKHYEALIGPLREALEEQGI